MVGSHFKIGEFLLGNGNIYDMTHEEIANYIGSLREIILKNSKSSSESCNV